MPRLPSISSRTTIAALKKAGFEVTGQKGSHIKLLNAQGVKVVVPNHSGDIKRPLLKSILKDAGLGEDEFRKFL